MNTLINSFNQEDQEKFSSLKNSVNKARQSALKKRLKSEPFMTNLEYLLGAFLEMYEPHLREIVIKLSKRGYAIETSSGFGRKIAEYQSLEGHFTVDYLTRNKLEKNGIKVRENNGLRSLVFWADKADLDYIRGKWLSIINTLPDKGLITQPSESHKALEFRREHVSKNPLLQRQRLFDRLQYSVQATTRNDIKKREKDNPKPDNIESSLGLFVEELEPQVKQAVLEMNRKGYCVDVSGFMSNSNAQMIEGDFRLEEKCINKLKTMGVTVETNPSGYTRLQFFPKEADIKKIKKQWNKVVSFLPNKNRTADASMTRKAREFRMKY